MMMDRSTGAMGDTRNPVMFNQKIDQLISDSTRILVAGAGGGYDVVCGLPIYLDLCDRGKETHLARLASFAISTVAR
jgi:hypothetical protein